MDFAKYIACICEGTAEEAVMNLLLDANLLIFNREKLLDEKVIRSRSAASFEKEYLRKGFTGQITVLRILDSRRENFKLGKAYVNKVDVINIITAPEIEMLIILKEGKYTEYKKSGKKPSDFCKTDLKMGNIKSKQFVMDYFADIDSLVNSIIEYKRVSNIPKGEYTLCDILK